MYRIMQTQNDFFRDIDKIVERFHSGVECCVVNIHSGRPWTESDCRAYEYVWKKLLYSDDEVVSQMRNLLPLTCLPVAKQHPESGESAVFGKVDACLAKMLSHSTKAVLRKGVLNLLVAPENLLDELFYCYLRYLVLRRPKLELPLEFEHSSLM